MEKEKIWKGRIQKDPDSAAEKFTSSINIDSKLYIQDITGTAAYAIGLNSIGIIPAGELVAILEGLKKVRSLIENSQIDFTDYEDVHSLVEYELLKIAGEPAARIHTGRSRNDQIVLDELLYMKESIAQAAQMILDLLGIILEKAYAYRDLIIPAYTHMQKAQPVLAAHYLLSYFEKFLRSLKRLFENFNSCDFMPLGAGACAGSGYPINTEMLADILKFSRTGANSMDIVSSRDYLIEYVFSLSMIMIDLSRFCEDLIIYNTQEFSFIEIDDSFCTGSSIMPQKKNPDVLELVRGRSALVIGNLFQLMVLFKGLPVTYNSDMQEDKKILFNSEKETKDCLDIFTRVISNTVFKEDIMAENKGENGFMEATDAADYLVKKGLSFRNAHHKAGAIVRYCLDNGMKLADLDLEVLKKYSEVFEEDFYEAIKIKSCINSKVTGSGTSPRSVEIRLDEKKEQMDMYASQIKSLQERIPDFDSIVSAYL